ncbi:hypothetical protein Acsp03_68120 [Actinomadura sp. NBRC 104412]|uniref:hypothetical protein n=1 Tax=Actinomadura sp. NBRC 104412 TaxID=3032203 RepID=UPI0024A56BB3|nr:hypothetical protein [Actinomadura sp. NBRC 104412]GLZ09346.1 hypothetical protein Acsp03_68120 [Actinomadura sp. NBRC 104412]
MYVRLYTVVGSLVLLVGMCSCGNQEKAAPPSPTATTVSPSKPKRAPGTQVGHYTNITLSRSYSLRFDDDPVNKRSVDGDLMFRQDISAHRISVLPADVRGGYRVCQNRTGRSRWLDFESVTAGRSICVITESGLVGLLEVRKFKTGIVMDRGILRFDLTLWQGEP